MKSEHEVLSAQRRAEGVVEETCSSPTRKSAALFWSVRGTWPWNACVGCQTRLHISCVCALLCIISPIVCAFDRYNVYRLCVPNGGGELGHSLIDAGAARSEGGLHFGQSAPARVDTLRVHAVFGR